ncbi:MAG: hypothetical protein LBT79_03705 [Elusimicrobiota bacterium]|nr:hypothetical protein [Elusimicrobiota bacterium]
MLRDFLDFCVLKKWTKKVNVNVPVFPEDGDNTAICSQLKQCDKCCVKTQFFSFDHFKNRNELYPIGVKLKSCDALACNQERNKLFFLEWKPESVIKTVDGVANQNEVDQLTKKIKDSLNIFYETYGIWTKNKQINLDRADNNYYIVINTSPKNKTSKLRAISIAFNKAYRKIEITVAGDTINIHPKVFPCSDVDEENLSF